MGETNLDGYIPAPGPGNRSLPPTGLIGGIINLNQKEKKKTLVKQIRFFAP